MSDEWEEVGNILKDVSPGAPEMSMAAFFDSKGLGAYTEKIIEATDAASIDDLKLIDASMVEDIIKSAELKLIPAKKFRLAIAELCNKMPVISSEQCVKDMYHQEIPVDSLANTTDAATEVSTQSQLPIQECIVICIDRSGSMGAPFLELTLNVVQGAITQRTRMEAVKAMFYAFRDRVESVSNKTFQLGLIQFDNMAETLLELTPQLDRFEAIVDDMEKRGQTAIYSAVLDAAQLLEKHFNENSQTDLRIVVLTDGQNNAGNSPENALVAVNKIGAVVDAIIVGDRPDANLRKIVQATGGECYQINNLGEGFELLESESVVSLRARRGGIDKPPFKLREMVDFKSISEKSLTRGGAVQRAPALAPDFAAKAVVDVTAVLNSTAVASSGISASAKRILGELKQLDSGAGDGVHIFPAPDNVNFWRVLIEGPPASPFEGGVFSLTVIIPNDYPFQPPKITFETPVYHCNVNDSGKICLDILQDKWSPALSVSKCLEAIRIMLKNPDTDNALRQWIAELTLAHEKSNGTDTRYYDEAQKCVRQEASLTVEDWKRNWNC